MIFDGSRQVTYDYLSAEADAVYERLNRVYQIKEGSTVLLETRSSPLGRAGYRELGTTTAITRSAWTAETDDGYDRFGRVAQMKYDAGASLRAQLNFGYDAGSNRLYREDVGAATIPTTGEDLDEFYSHDALSRLTLFQLGDVTSGATPSMAVGDTGFRQAWVLDQLGNWGIFGEDVDGGTTYNAAGDTLQTRQHNIANEIDTDDDHSTAGNAIDDALPAPATSDWVDPTYDAAGNLTRRPDPTDPDDASDAHEITYDAWNRVVKIEDSTGTIAFYGYDGLSRRTSKFTVSDTLLYYYNESWQVVQVLENGLTNPREQFVYDPAYIDALAVRWYDANQDGSADKQFYLYDESFSVIALTDDAGGVLERYRYTRYGERYVMDDDFALKSGGTDHAQHRGFQGLLHDAETGLIENRMRMLDPTTGRFLQRDPIGYPDGMNAYVAYHVMFGGVDPLGLKRSSTVGPKERSKEPIEVEATIVIRKKRKVLDDLWLAEFEEFFEVSCDSKGSVTFRETQGGWQIVKKWEKMRAGLDVENQGTLRFTTTGKHTADVEWLDNYIMQDKEGPTRLAGNISAATSVGNWIYSKTNLKNKWLRKGANLAGKANPAGVVITGTAWGLDYMDDDIYHTVDVTWKVECDCIVENGAAVWYVSIQQNRGKSLDRSNIDVVSRAWSTYK